MHSIGALARASGLSVSALRFYDGAGVLVPALVDPQTGYRWYTDDQVRPARLVAGLRRVGMPLADITEALERLSDPAAVRRLLDVHLRRLEDGLVDARRELSRVHALLDLQERLMTRVTLSGADLLAAIAAVRYAVSDDPDLPMIGGVLIEAGHDGLRLVATDRYRLAVSTAPVAHTEGPPVTLIAPKTLIDTVRTQPASAAPVTLTLSADKITIDGYAQRLAAPAVDLDFPDYRRLLGRDPQHPPVRPITVDVHALRASLTSADTPIIVREHEGVPHELAVLAIDDTGALTLADQAAGAADTTRVAVNRHYLLQALDAGGSGQLVLELDGPVRPLAIRVPEDAQRFSILMPVRL